MASPCLRAFITLWRYLLGARGERTSGLSTGRLIPVLIGEQKVFTKSFPFFWNSSGHSACYCEICDLITNFLCLRLARRLRKSVNWKSHETLSGLRYWYRKKHSGPAKPTADDSDLRLISITVLLVYIHSVSSISSPSYFIQPSLQSSQIQNAELT